MCLFSTSSAVQRRSDVVLRTMPSLVLVVEDEQDLLAALDFNLKREGYATVLASTGKAALELVRGRIMPDLILLDLMLPDASGADICAKLRGNRDTQHIPIIMLTALGSEQDRVAGLESGADDYVAKPFSVRELMLRIRALMRRAQPHEQGSRIDFGRLTVDKAAHRVFVDDQEVELTVLEFKLLTVLLDGRGTAQTRDELLHKVWDITAEVTTRTVDTHVKRLRNKLKDASGYIETLRGVGYRFRAEPND